MDLVTIGTPALWLVFVAGVLGLLALDLGVFHRAAHVVRFREALVWSVVWVVLALGFNAFIAWEYGGDRGLEFLTGYLIEKALAVDNIFVFLVVFATFQVPRENQHRILFWGILGALVMRAAFIFAGAALLQRFGWVMYVFGAFLVATGVKLFVHRDADVHPERNPLFRVLTRFVPSVPEYHGSRFTVVKAGRRYATPMLLVLVCIEATDIVFAVDSIPAIFAVTRDPFIVFTSNIFAILGLRAMFFLLAGVIDRFRYLRPALALVLAFVGVKMLLAHVHPIPVGVSLGVIGLVLAGAAAASWLRDGSHAQRRARGGGDRDDGGMLQPSLDRDRVEALADVGQAAGDDDAVVTPKILLEDRRRRKEAEPRLPEDAQERAVLDLGDDVRTDVVGGQPLIERTAERRSRRRQEERRARERARKAAPDRADVRRRPEDRHSRFAEEVVERVHARPGPERRVRDDHVELVRRELREQRDGRPLRAEETDRDVERQRGREQPVRDQLRHLVGDADGEVEWPAGGTVPDRVEQLASEPEDLLGVAKDGAADVREDEPSALAPEQALVEDVLELPDLRADGRLGEPQLVRRLRDAPLLRGEPEVEQVVVVEPVHGRR